MMEKRVGTSIPMATCHFTGSLTAAIRSEVPSRGPGHYNIRDSESESMTVAERTLEFAHRSSQSGSTAANVLLRVVGRVPFG